MPSCYQASLPFGMFSQLFRLFVSLSWFVVKSSILRCEHSNRVSTREHLKSKDDPILVPGEVGSVSTMLDLIPSRRGKPGPTRFRFKFSFTFYCFIINFGKNIKEFSLMLLCKYIFQTFWLYIWLWLWENENKINFRQK